MKTTHAVWELENIGANAYEIALDAADTPELLAAEEACIIAQGAEYIVVKTPVNCPQLLLACPSWATPLWRWCSMWPSAASTTTCRM